MGNDISDVEEKEKTHVPDVGGYLQMHMTVAAYLHCLPWCVTSVT